MTQRSSHERIASELDEGVAASQVMEAQHRIESQGQTGRSCGGRGRMSEKSIPRDAHGGGGSSASSARSQPAVQRHAALPLCTSPPAGSSLGWQRLPPLASRRVLGGAGVALGARDTGALRADRLDANTVRAGVASRGCPAADV